MVITPVQHTPFLPSGPNASLKGHRNPPKAKRQIPWEGSGGRRWGHSRGRTMVREDSVISCHGAVEAPCSPGLQWPCEQVRPVGSEGCLLPAFPWPLLSGFFPAGTSQRLNG